ncbi:hypothetical protein [Nonomuraea dietziae]|uniref:hypothetical protein n=1 Tax=Nonomuraea dietziae TaxID=65515 RepID=UPI0033F66D54
MDRPAVGLAEITPPTCLKGERLVVLRPEGWRRDYRADSDPFQSADGTWRIRVLPEAAWYVLRECGLMPPDTRIEDVPLTHAMVETWTDPAASLW